MFERILVTLDGSRFSARALPYAVETAKRFHAELLLLQVVQPAAVTLPTAMAPAEPMVNPEATRIIVESAREQDRRNVSLAKRYLRKKYNEATARGIKASFHVLVGEPAQEIIGFSKKEKVGLVVMTTRGKSGLKRAFLGSVADAVIRHPGLPVLAIRPPERRTKK